MQLQYPISVLLIEFVTDKQHGDALTTILEQAKIEVIRLTESVERLPFHAQFSKKPLLTILLLDQHSRGNREEICEFMARLPEGTPMIVAAEDFSATEICSLLELGVTDFITPPFTATNILPRVWQILAHNGSCTDNGASLEEKLGLQRIGLIGESPAFLAEIRRLRLLARCDVKVMIWGETGTGKELVARAIHYLSPRNDRPFVPVDCGAIPPELAESELFGHERGAFTGAVTKHRGLIHAADRGTLFLDEVDALTLNIQAKLLRLLQELEYRPVGSSETKKVDVRVISATNRDLQQLVRSGEFREDLFYRLNVAQLQLPALRQRQGDIAILARYFVSKHSTKFHLTPRQFSHGALQKLLLHQWPGNIRELENVVEAAVALSDGPVIRARDLLLASQSESPTSFREAKARMITDFEREYIVRLLNACGGNISEAARAAGKNRRAFWELMRKHEVDVREIGRLASKDNSENSNGHRVRHSLSC